MRPGWDRYFLVIAQAVSARATCSRLHVGAVIVQDNRIIATGYNGSIPGEPHCEDDGCARDESGACQRTIHAEQNAILQAAQYGVPVKGATLYCTCSPCSTCFKLLAGAGIARVVYAEQYRLAPDLALALRCGIKLDWIVDEP